MNTQKAISILKRTIEKSCFRNFKIHRKPSWYFFFLTLLVAKRMAVILYPLSQDPRTGRVAEELRAQWDLYVLDQGDLGKGHQVELPSLAYKG